ILAWQPDIVHLTGYAYASHFGVLRLSRRKGIPLLFRGDSHVLDPMPGWRWQIKRALLGRIYRWPAGFLYVGRANVEDYRRLGGRKSKLFCCPHSIDVERFAEATDQRETEAKNWRRELGIQDRDRVLLFAGKFERKKRPVELMDACLELQPLNLVLVMAGDGE